MTDEANQDAIYRHPPGTLSPRGVLDVGLKCPHSCKFCYYSFWDKSGDQFRAIRQASYRSGDDCRAILDGLAAGGLGFYDITGGEPRAHPQIEEIVRHGAQLGLRGRLITLGQFAPGDGRLEKLLEAGLCDFLFSLHTVEQDMFRQFTGGSWERLRGAMDALDARGFSYGANTVIFEGNFRELETIAREAAGRGVYVHNFILFNAYHAWNVSGRVAGVQASYAEIAPVLSRAAACLDAAGIAVNIRYAPLCVFPGLTRHVVGVLGLPYDPFEWRNRACNHDKAAAYCAEILPIPASGVREQFAFSPLAEKLQSGVELMGMRGNRFTLFPSLCADCAALPACDGLAPSYLERHGVEELCPFPQAHLVGPLLGERLDYKLAHRVKAAPFSVMRPCPPARSR